MLYQVVFSVQGACQHVKSKEVETVTLDGHKPDGNFWSHVIHILKRREGVNSVVAEWMSASACKLKKERLGLEIVVYEAARHPYTQQVECCRSVYRNKS